MIFLPNTTSTICIRFSEVWLYCLDTWLVTYIGNRKDDTFIANKLQVVENFYIKNNLPELLTRKLENFEKKKIDGEKEKHYCYCIYNEDETWIGCDSETCK